MTRSARLPLDPRGDAELEAVVLTVKAQARDRLMRDLLGCLRESAEEDW